MAEAKDGNSIEEDKDLAYAQAHAAKKDCWSRARAYHTRRPTMAEGEHQRWQLKANAAKKSQRCEKKDCWSRSRAITREDQQWRNLLII
jgi:hypothetical protein